MVPASGTAGYHGGRVNIDIAENRRAAGEMQSAQIGSGGRAGQALNFARGPQTMPRPKGWIIGLSCVASCSPPRPI